MKNDFESRKDGGAARPQLNVLIVDDDADSALLIESVFAHLGCQTECTLNPAEAKKRICSQKADVIILDWVLDECTDAKKITDHCQQIFDKFGSQRAGRKPVIVTYSGLRESEIDLLKSPYFDHLEHWQKPISHQELLRRSLVLLGKLKA